MRRWFWLALCLWGCAPAPEKSATPQVSHTPKPVPVIASRAPAEWTLIFYFAADNDLEDAELSDLEELTRIELEAKPEQKVRILALMDRSPLGKRSEGYSNRAVANQANWNGAKLLEVTQDKLTEIDDWGKLNMADPQTLKRLVLLAQDKYPAQRYALFLVDHGKAWAGLCSDNSASRPDDTLDLKELGQALEGLEKPLELLAFDACMMGSLEVYLALAPSTRTMIASQDTLPGEGLEYHRALSPLLARPQMSGREVGSSFLEAYRQSMVDDPEEMGRLQLALLDSAPHADLAKAWQNLSLQLLKVAKSQWMSLALSRAKAQTFRVETDPRQGAEVHDVGQLLLQFRQRIPTLAPAVQAVEKQLHLVVVEQVLGRFRKSTGGLSVFFPPQAEYLSETPDLDYVSSIDGLAPGWVAFLKQFTKLERDFQSRPTLSKVQLVRKGKRIDLQARVGERKTIAQSYTILVRDNRVLGQTTCALPEDSTLLRDFFDGRWIVLKEKSREQALYAQLQSVELESPQSAYALATLSCQLKRKDNPGWSDARLYFALKPEDPELSARFLGVQRGSGLGWVDTQLEPGDELAFLEVELEAGGHPKLGPSLTITDPRNLQLIPENVAKGAYELGFLVIDIRGARHWQSQPLKWPE